jgi:acyl-CoA thioesterase FadM
MNLWFRILQVLWHLAWCRVTGKPSIDLFEVSRLTLRVWPNDLDTNLHVNNGRYLTIADLGRLDWFVRAGVLKVARTQKAMPVVGDALAKFRKSLNLFQTFTLETRLLGWDEKWGFIEHRFVRKGRVLGVIVIRGVFLGAKGPMRPNQLLSGLAHEHPSPLLPQWVQEWNDSCEVLSVTLRREEGRDQ